MNQQQKKLIFLAFVKAKWVVNDLQTCRFLENIQDQLVGVCLRSTHPSTEKRLKNKELIRSSIP